MTVDDYAGHPGADLVEKGWRDAKAGLSTHESLLVQIGAPRLARLGIEVRADPSLRHSPELELYSRLAQEDENSAHSRYNALIRRLISFEHSLELERAVARRRG